MAAPASFWRRVAAYGLDLAAVGIVAVPLVAASLQEVPAQVDAGIAALQLRMEDLAGEALLTGELWDFPRFLSMLADDPLMRDGAEALAHTLLDAATASVLTLVVVAAIWFVGFESSARQATPGKAALGLRVTDAHGARPPPGRVLGRFAAGSLSWLSLNLGHALAGLRADGRALHDLIAGTSRSVHASSGTAMATTIAASALYAAYRRANVAGTAISPPASTAAAARQR